MTKGPSKEFLWKAIRHEDRPSHPVVCCGVVLAGDAGRPEWLYPRDCMVYVGVVDIVVSVLRGVTVQPDGKP